MLDDKQQKLVKAIASNQFEEVKYRIHPREYHRLFTDFIATSPNFTINEWGSLNGNFTPLFIAVYYQHLLPIKELIACGSDPDALIDVKIIDETQNLILDFHGSVFDYALKYCESDIILALPTKKPLHTYQQMITHHGDIVNLMANPAYLVALAHNQFTAAITLFQLDHVSKNDINEQIYFDDQIITPLQLATFNQNPAQEEWLLLRGAEVNLTSALQGLIARENLHPVLQYFPPFLPNGTWLDLKLLPLHIACALNDTQSGALLQRHGAALFGIFDDCARNYMTWQNAINMQNKHALVPYHSRQEQNEGSIVPYILTSLILLFFAVMMYYNRRSIKNQLNKCMFPHASRKNSNDTLFPSQDDKTLTILGVMSTVFESDGCESNSDERTQLLTQRSTK